MSSLTQNKPNFDEVAVRKLLTVENQFLSNLWQKLPIPYSAREQTDDDDDAYLLPDKSGTSGKQRKIKIFKPAGGGKKTERAKSLEELYAKRNALKGSIKLKYKDKLLKKGLKHKITKQRRKQERKMKKNLLKAQKSSTGFGSEVERKIMPVKPVFNSEGKMVFSKFDFTGSEGMHAEKRPKENQNPKLILEKLQKQKEKRQQLESQGKADLATQMKEKEAWKKALKKAQGEKVKDDVELLKKSVRKEKELKQRSKKKWEERLAAAEKLREKKQRTRMENILKRKKDVKKKKLKKASKKGRVILGS